jgi:hypothetical protein
VLAGSIPTEFSKLINLNYCHISGNTLTGTVRTVRYALLCTRFALAELIRDSASLFLCYKDAS